MLLFDSVNVLVIGDIMLDKYVSARVSRISPEAPVPVALVGRKWNSLGGAANVARNLARLGCRVCLAALCGQDEAGKNLRELAEGEGIATSFVLSGTRPTTAKTRIMAQGQQLLRVDEEDLSDIPSEKLEELWQNVESLLPKSQIVILSDYNKGLLRRRINGNSLCGQVIDACRARNIPVLVDPKTTDWQRYAGASCLTPNTLEMEQKTGMVSDELSLFEDAAQKIMDSLNVERILLTRSEKGMALMSRGESSLEIPAQALEVADVSGAGDTVIAVLAACVAKGLSWENAARVANLAGGIVVGKVGTRPVELTELRAALAERPDLASL